MSHARFSDGIVIENPGRVSPWVVRTSNRILFPIVRLCHRATLEGSANLPEKGAFLLVANHSAGLGIAEILTFLALYLRAFGASRPLAGFALPIGFRVAPLKWGMRAVGAVPSTYEAAKATLGAGVPILIFPGGDHETLRPLWEAHRVDLAGRIGFLRIAREQGVPVVPLGIRGSHFTAPILFRANALATLLVAPRLIGTKRWGVSLLAVIGAVLIALCVPAAWYVRAILIYVWMGSPLVFLPWVPWKIRMRIGTPIANESIFSVDHADHGTDEELGRALGVVQSAVQALVDR